MSESRSGNKIGRLKDLGNKCPDNIYILGELTSCDWEKCAAIVGSRKMTEYGRRVIEGLTANLVEDGWTIISGFMHGVDWTAHTCTVNYGGKTVAVLGWGIKYQMTNEQCLMSNKIISSGGLVISEWKDQEPERWTFPLRDRIMAALAQRIYVVEAAERSGSLITVEWGRKLGREIWAVPGPVTSKVSEGTNKLIADGKAKVWLPSYAKATEGQARYTNDTEIYILLQNEVLTVDEIVRKTGQNAQEIGSKLTMMMLRGDVVEKEGKYYINN